MADKGRGVTPVLFLVSIWLLIGLSAAGILH